VNEDAAPDKEPCIFKEANRFQGIAHQAGLNSLHAANIAGVHMKWFSVIIKVDAYLVDMKHSERGGEDYRDVCRVELVRLQS